MDHLPLFLSEVGREYLLLDLDLAFFESDVSLQVHYLDPDVLDELVLPQRLLVVLGVRPDEADRTVLEMLIHRDNVLVLLDRLHVVVAVEELEELESEVLDEGVGGL